MILRIIDTHACISTVLVALMMPAPFGQSEQITLPSLSRALALKLVKDYMARLQLLHSASRGKKKLHCQAHDMARAVSACAQH
jgi:hypothetical protein